MSNPAPATTPTPAAPPTPAPPTPTPAPSTPDATSGDETLGAGGVAALKAEREARALADKKANDLQAQLDAIADKDKTEAERQQAALEKAQAELAETLAAKSRAEVAATKSVPMELLAGPTSSEPADIEAYADALLTWRGDVKQTPSSSAIGRTNASDATVGSEADLFAQHLAQQLG